ncbi:MAG: hypothetical protein J7L59_02500 [Nanoarchaeota archaeon]|nr:hypothetical protein [Nanoarchaeota archaeon]
MELTIELLFLVMTLLLLSSLLIPLEEDFDYDKPYSDEVLLRFMEEHGHGLASYLCGGNWNSEEGKELLERLNRPGYNYILYASLGGREVRLFNEQGRVCLERVLVSRFHLRTTCGETDVLLGFWRGKAPEVCP